ncbi:SDR family NAD(P)-dependent oxidoreductase [Zoogloea sp.]|uniref:SDR family NAD(P)-dependent oxidoreductase n=1 Tax=Zoogloea sp. TaxID=49181 RepID=UPI00260E10F8|nr:SDR family NAD(P)-dependent oxidoreductase [Zoogloea sp.]MDD3352705.1 SDR family NAD(P)-dependent oxidoreductase [Zoogloea sp.]
MSLPPPAPPPAPGVVSLSSLREGYQALVIGATGAIGGALFAHLQADPRCLGVTGLSRSSDPPVMLEDETSLAHAARALRNHPPFQLVIDATGALSLDGMGPEKRLDDLQSERLQRALLVNAVGPVLLLRHFLPLLAGGERVIWAKLSARVGSIEDNHKGGWYGYRAGKAALNMLLQTAAIEIARRRPQAVVAALQPGTVRSPLSRPFVGDDALAPEESGRRLLAVLDTLPASGRAHFVDHQGQSIPW